MRGHGHAFASAKGKQQKYVQQLQCQEQCIDYIPYYLSGLLHARFYDNLSRKSCIYLRKQAARVSKAGHKHSVNISRILSLAKLWSRFNC